MPSKPNILIVGQTGSGKSSCFEKLLTGPHAKEVAFLDLERKGFPFLFDHTKLGYFAEPEDLFKTEDAMKVAHKTEGVKIIIYDSLSKYLDYVRTWAQSTKSGWDVWNAYNAKAQQFVDFNKATNKVTIATIHDEVVSMDTPDGGKVSRLRAFIQGKQFEGKIEKEFLIVPFTFARKDGSSIKHQFQMHTDGLTSAKCPQWMNLDQWIPNDVTKILDKLYEKGLV